MQNPAARDGIAWWRPPPGWNAWSTSPRRIASIARSDPPATIAPASCIPWKGGSSPGPIPASDSAHGSRSASENRWTTRM